MQWNAEGLMRNTDRTTRILIYDVYKKTHLQKDKIFKVRGYQCFRTDRGGDMRKGGIVTNAYMSSSLTDGPDQCTVTVKTLEREIILVNYYYHINVNLELHNIHARDNNFIILEDFNRHSQSWGYATSMHEKRRLKHGRTILTLINQPYASLTFYSRCWHTTSTPDIALCTLCTVYGLPNNVRAVPVFPVYI